MSTFFFSKLQALDSVDCGSKICQEEFRILPTCIIYVDKSEEEKCEYPCSEKNCQKEIHHLIECPVWICSDKTTTTPASTTTLGPDPYHPQCSSPLCISSVSINGILILVAIIGLVLFLNKKYGRRTPNPPRNQHCVENPTFDPNFDSFFPSTSSRIIRSTAERLPLLGSERTRTSASLDPSVSHHSTSATASRSTASPIASAPNLFFDETTF